MMRSSTHQAAAVELLTAQISTTVVSHVLCSEVQEQEPVHGSAGGPRQRLHHTRNIRPGAAFLDRTWSSVYTRQPGLAWYLHWRWVSKYTHTHVNLVQFHTESVSGKQLWSILVWEIWELHMFLTQLRESGTMWWLVLITTAIWTSVIMV